MPPLFECKNLSFEYQLGCQKVSALSNINLSINHGDYICFSGPSGSGKTTLLNLLGLIEPLQTGSIHLSGVSYDALTEKMKNKIRRFQLGFIFQNFQLLDVLSAQENVEYFLIRQGIPKNERLSRVQEALSSVGLWEHRIKKPHEMSGGQRQRVAVARALAKKPDVICADEPTASLDQESGYQIIQILKKLCEQQNITIIISSHDPMAIACAKRIVKLKDGRIINIEEGQ